MWVSKNLDRARRRLRPTSQLPAVTTDEAPVEAVDGVVALSLVRAELDRLIAALAASLDPSTPRPDSPARLEDALSTVIVRIGGRGRPTVTRSPAALYSPEYWHLRVEGADARTRSAVARLATGERVA
jgi:hypothetical protein